MCRYALARYAEHYVCVACRVSVKGHFLGDARGTRRCPHCAGLLAAMGRDFAAPRRRDDRAWRALARHVAAGTSFESCGHASGQSVARTPGALRAEATRRERLATTPSAGPGSLGAGLRRALAQRGY